MPFRVTDQMEFRKEGAKKKHQPESPYGVSHQRACQLCQNYLNLTQQHKLIFTVFYFCEVCFVMLQIQSLGDCGDALFQLAHARDEDL